MQILILRNRARSNAIGTYGRMLLDGAAFCFTVEQPWNNNEQGHSCVPTGEFQLLPYNSLAHGPTVVFHNPVLNIYGTPAMIPAGHDGRSLCEIHNANWPFQLKGCVAVGEQLVDIAPHGLGVTNSIETLHKLFARWGDRHGLTAKVAYE